MTLRFGIRLLLLIVLMMGVASPVVAAAVACVEDGCADCCGVECNLCLCCPISPQARAGELHDPSAVDPDGSLEPAARPALPEPLPRDVLHVPKAVSLR